MPHSNLDCFLNCTTPTVRSQFLPKTPIWNLNADWQPLSKDEVEYFNLGDLWDRYDEWSAYGVGAPIQDSGETVVQYYTPFLSAIQIYTAKNASSRDAKEDCDGEFDSTSWSSESEDTKSSRSSSSSSDKMWDMEDLGIGLDSHWTVRNRLGELYFEYFEGDSPFGRVPLKDKVDALAQKYPGLKSFNSVELSPGSWMAIAWYPIYQIPTPRNAKELYASFLTYHTLSSSFQDDFSEEMDDDTCHTEAARKEMKCKGENNSISLPPFGLATYRLQSKVWLNPETSDHVRISSLLSVADSWLKQLQVQHPDFNYFVSHPM